MDLSMKTAIFTLTIGDPSGYIPCMLSARNYAWRHNISYFKGVLK